jgi:hypothetical protein
VARRYRLLIVSSLALAASAIVLSGTGFADSTPVGPLPAGPSSSIVTQKGQLVAFALPHRAGGKVWRVARAFDGKVLQQVTEGDVGADVVLVFKARAAGTTTVTFALTRGETAKAYESRRYTVRVQ